MNPTIFSENLKKYRLRSSLTQEQVADRLGVNAQTVSRWECGTTLPDVLMLPELAKLYQVAVDDFYKKYSVAYENYAAYLSSVYEKTRDPEDFLRCILEYQKLMKYEELSIADKWNYAIAHQFMLFYCKDTALEWYRKLEQMDPADDPHSYYRALSCQMSLLIQLGQSEDVINRRLEALRNAPDDPRVWDLLIQAYLFTKNHEAARSYFHQAIERFPNDWQLYILGGDICQTLKDYDSAFRYWEKAGEIGTFFYDELYCKANCYRELSDYEKSALTYLLIADKLRQKGYDAEAEMAEESAKEVRLLLK